MATDPARRPRRRASSSSACGPAGPTALPTGVVTFCLSDIEGSTALWDADPEAMAERARAPRRADRRRRRGATAAASSSRWARATRPSRCSTRRPTPSRPRSPPTARWRPSRGRAGIAHRRRAGACTPARPSGAAPTTSARRVNLAARVRGAGRRRRRSSCPSATAELVAGHLPDGCALVDLGPHRLQGRRRARAHPRAQGPGRRAPPPATECPYRGLLAFEADDRASSSAARRSSRELLERARARPAARGRRRVGQRQVLAAARRRRRRRARRRGRRASSARVLLTPGAEPPLDVARRADAARRRRPVRGAVHAVRRRRPAAARSSTRCWRCAAPS